MLCTGPYSSRNPTDILISANLDLKVAKGNELSLILYPMGNISNLSHGIPDLTASYTI